MSPSPRPAALLAVTALALGGLSAVVAAAPAATAAPASALTVDVSRYTAQTNPTQWGHIVEDINHSVEGGLDANLVRNSTMKENAANPPAYWSVATAGGGTGSISLDGTTPLSAANRNALKLTVGQDTAGQRVGAANGGFYGVGLRPRTTYTADFWARTANYTGPLQVSLEGLDGTVYGAARTGATTSGWTEYRVNVTTSAATPASTSNRVVIGVPAGASGATVWLNVVQVLPPTYGTSGILRTDLMQKMAAIDPGFWRIPGGNYLEGQTLATRFDWKQTIGPLRNRPGHQNDAWGYWSTDQAGLKAYLDMAEQSGAEPLLAVFAGYTLNGTVVPEDQLQPYVQDALDEIQYVTGDASTPWGRKRAADGHPKPYSLHYVEVGNEDFFDGSGSYDAYRYPAFHDAIKAAYPDLQVIATTPVTTRTPDVLDEHYYNNDPAAFTAMAHQYDGYDRSGPKVLVGEYAITNGVSGNPTGSLAGALGEAGYMTGMVRNADVVVGASYAPALADVNDYQWPTNLIGFDALNSYGSPSYYVQQMFGTNKGRYVLPSTLTGADSSISYVATRGEDGRVFVHVVNPTGTPLTTRVNLTGATAISTSGTVTTLTGDPAARNTITAPTTIAPTTRSFASGAAFTRTFPANSVTEFTVGVSGEVTPALVTDQLSSLRVTTPGYTDRSVAVANGVGVTDAVTTASSDAARKGATLWFRPGLAGTGCYSIEPRIQPGTYLTVTADHRVVTAAPGTTTAAKAAQTWCVEAGHGGSGVSLRSYADSSRYLRHYANVLYAASNGGPEFFAGTRSFDVDTTFTVGGPFWRSGADVTLGRHTLSPLTGGTGRVLAHMDDLAQVVAVGSGATAAQKQSATFTVLPGRADSSCYTFESVDEPGKYLRHYDYRVRLDAPAGAVFDQDATFCAQPGNSGQGVSFQSIGFPTKYLRDLGGDVYIGSNGGSRPGDASAGWAAATSWRVRAPLAPAA